MNDAGVPARIRDLSETAEQHGYHLNPDMETVQALVRGLMVNENRYGYPSCPCRLASGRREEDLDIICPCDYRDTDLAEFGTCYCALYVTRDVAEGGEPVRPIPDRRPPPAQRISDPASIPAGTFPSPVFRCPVCGYLCARDGPPEVCPICGVSGDRFRRFV